MYEKNMMVSIYVETPMHPGSGAVINSPVDLPIQRERHTDYPIIQGSTLKGVLRSCAENVGFSEDDVKRIFGPEKGEEGAGAIAVTDGKILAFPVRTLAGAFGWVTCPTVLSRFQRDLINAGFEAKWDIPEVPSDTSAIVPKNSGVKIENFVYIEDFRLSIDDSKNISNIVDAIQLLLPEGDVYKLIRDKLAKDLIVISDEVFKYLVKYATEITPRIKIDPQTGKAAEGALFYEEYLPADTLMYALILLTKRVKNDDVTKLLNFKNKVIQIGGNETVGRGFAKIRVVMPDAKKP
ncbi:MAG: type III-B CRISPR module RAMP protein Cmr4 [Thermoplasmata archaeon]